MDIKESGEATQNDLGVVVKLVQYTNLKTDIEPLIEHGGQQEMIDSTTTATTSK